MEDIESDRYQKMKESGGNISPSKIDARTERPRNWEEVKLLQTAINPSILHFAMLTNRQPDMPSEWLPYNDQWAYLQMQLEQRMGLPGQDMRRPRLVRLGKWTGGILNEEVATKLRQKTYIDQFNPRDPGRAQILAGTIQEAERQRVHDMAETFGKELEQLETHQTSEPTPIPGNDLNMAKVGRAKLQNVDLHALYPRDPFEIAPEAEAADMLIAQDPEAYLQFLYTDGFQFFQGLSQQISWDEWCSDWAPQWYRQDLLDIKESKKEERKRGAEPTKHGKQLKYQSIPVLTYDQAELAHRRWKANGSHRTRTEGRRGMFQAFHAIKGKDVFLTQAPRMQVEEEPPTSGFQGAS